MRTREQELAGVAARVASLEELIASREGYGDAARLLLTAADAPFKHMGAVADHLQVDREHELAVEAGLDDLLHALVVGCEQDARRAMEFLAEHGGGRCGFAIAEALEAGAAPAAPADASLMPFTDLVRVSGPGSAAVKILLARHWLAPSFDAASQAAHATGGTVVTPDGTVFRGAAVVRGGGRSEQGVTLRRPGSLADLGAGQAPAEVAGRRGRAQLRALAAEAAAAEAALKALQEDERARERELLDAEHRMSRCDEDNARLAQRCELVHNEERRAREERATKTATQDEARESISRLEQERETADQHRASAQQRLADARTALQALSTQVSAARVAHAELAERTAGLETAVRGIEAAAAELDRRAQTCTADRQRAIDRSNALQASIADAGTRVDEEVRQLDARRSDVRDLDARAAGLRAGMDEQAQEVHGARQALETCRTERSGLEVDRARAEVERGKLEESCSEAFQTGLDQVCAEVEQLERDGVIADDARRLAADDDAAEPVEQPTAAAAAGDAPQPPPAAAIVARLRARVERLGPVNMMAVEQFDELEQRHEFLTAQRADLLESIKSTGEAIERINTTTRDRFRQAFHAVNEHLQQTFSTLFGGGSASLVLLDEADLLESGIDIVAQPPGKRLQSVQLLSGGEKALAAMALMFAIFKYRPSPFCLLDEIDAPLDDANIGRFVEVLRGMQDETQFVLVTHNRKTMEIADRLYGVTMEEPGVSKLVSVWFN
ncbi:MAG: hypothetical protein F4Y57_12215 [Acidobacteria bacterium]|nr:hypothetical protein [Acidobacteriota bacterium]